MACVEAAFQKPVTVLPCIIYDTAIDVKYGFTHIFVNRNITKFDKIVFVRCSVNQYWGCLFFTNINIFRHLKLEIELKLRMNEKWKQTIPQDKG